MEWGIDLDYKNKSLSINQNLMMTFSIIIVLTMLAIYLFVTNIFQKAFEQYVDESNQVEFEHLIQFDLNNIYIDDWDLQLIKDLGVDAIRKGIVLQVYDDQGHDVWDVFQDEKVLSDYTLNEISKNMQSIDKGWKDTIEDYKVPIIHPQQGKVGMAHVSRYASTYYMDNDIELFNSVNKMILFIGVISIGSVIVLSAFIAKSISNPIAKVSKMAKELSTGQNKKELGYKSHLKEVDELIFSINKLAIALNEQERLRKQLTTDIAHELRTPLTTIKGHLDLIIVGIWEPTPQRLQSISEEVTRISQLVDELRKLAKFDQEQVKLNKEDILITEFLEPIIYNFQAQAYDKKIRIEMNLIETMIKIDVKKFSQVMINLLSNAIKYTPEGGTIHFTIRELPYEREGYALFQTVVEDTGIGISKEYIPHLFEAFSREKSSSESGIIGTGLGLRIVKKFVDLMEGSIVVESEIGKGTRFTVTIPHRIATANEYISEENAKELSEEITLNNVRILLAEDNMLNAEIAMTLLADANAYVELAPDGEKALSMLKRATDGYYDLIIMDIQMPHMNGYEATKNIRGLPDGRCRIPIIAMTANAFEEDRKRAIESGMNGYVTKPIKIEELISTIKKILKS